MFSFCFLVYSLQNNYTSLYEYVPIVHPKCHQVNRSLERANIYVRLIGYTGSIEIDHRRLTVCGIVFHILRQTFSFPVLQVRIEKSFPKRKLEQVFVSGNVVSNFNLIKYHFKVYLTL
jgi:hypothetical protein